MQRTILRILAVAAVGAACLYLGLLALLYSEQRQMLFVRGRTAEPPLPVYRVEKITEDDGTRLTVWRADAATAKAPVAVFFYGNGGTLSDFARIGAALHGEGYGIVLASYRGYSGNAGEPSEDGLMRDARAVLGALPKDHGAVVLWGQSLGTGVAARMASEGRAGALILQSPYTSVADVAARRYPFFPVHWLMRDPFDTLSVVDKIGVPVLIMSGTADAVVPHDMAQMLTARFGARATFVPIPGGGHDLAAWNVLAIAKRWLSHVVIPGRAKRGE
jgi:fermentation-respiration switch protein FrsA (DUF1100 family)